MSKQGSLFGKVVIAFIVGLLFLAFLHSVSNMPLSRHSAGTQTEQTDAAENPDETEEAAPENPDREAPSDKKNPKKPAESPGKVEKPVKEPNNVPAAPNAGNPTTAANGDIRFNDYLPTLSLGKQVVRHSYYSLSYADAYEQAEWVAYELTKARLSGSHEERDDNFRSDPLVRTGSADPDDYKRSGYDRGHLAPAADMAFNHTAMSESFFMSNMSPQEPGFNRGIWKELEEQVRDYARAFGHLYVITGPILKNNTIGSIGRRNKVSIPNSYYKVLLDVTGKEHKGIAFILPNASSHRSLISFAVSIDEVERLTGIDFFPFLTKEQESALEGKVNTQLWSRYGD
jgi:endonuclease G